MLKLKTKNSKLEWEKAADVEGIIKELLSVLELPHIDSKRIFSFRTKGSKSRAYARIWAMPKVFQKALSIEPAYVIEVLSKYFDKLNEDEKRKVLIHELLHIPKNFSGALLQHKSRNRHLEKNADSLFKEYKKMAK
ncbi:MAG: metallopeptidase [Candidatus Levybacteria bacterium]|nr:metallopeptidase [Candidatus Levybacteria bacterium]